MNPNQRKYHGQIEITDLVAEAVSNAAARRNQVLDAEESLSPLSDEQAGAVTGGRIFPDPICPYPEVMGFLPQDSLEL
jgi:hypothetical protein